MRIEKGWEIGRDRIMIGEGWDGMGWERDRRGLGTREGKEKKRDWRGIGIE